MFLDRYDFKEIESKAHKRWEEHRVAEQTIKHDPSKPLFSWLEGPPTANAPPGLHHVEVRVFKDLVNRFKYMQGHSVPRKGGWDCHGLPVEVQVEKKLGLKTKKEVIDYGVAEFNKLCREDVFSYINDWNALTDRMAFWVDLKTPYITMTNDYIESVWWSLKELHKKKLLYEGHKVVPYCPRCETPLSSHEVAQGYKDVTEASITTKFEVKEKVQGKTRYLLAWTTTPWTTPANVALAVNPNIIYAVVEHEGTQYILAKDLIAKHFDEVTVIQELTGEELAGTEYIPLFNYFVDKVDKPAWKVVTADYVTTEDGTGIVHTAPAFGEDDYETVKRNDLPFVQPVDLSGKFTDDVTDFAGLFVKDADEKIIEQLEKDNLLFSKQNYTHPYPFCWRCSTPLLYYAITTWFVKVTAMKDKLLANNERIKWYPEHIKHGRFGNWLENVKDWALSRTKFWGTPLPIWRCQDCNNEVAIGSIEELLDQAVNMPKDLDLHKPMIDDVKLKCDCGSELERVPDVIDTWYDSGSASFAQYHYPFENQEMFQHSFPYSHIVEAIDQTRGWFYTLHVLGTLLFDTQAYKSCVVAGHVVDESGEKMSKSKGNILNPNQVFDEIGVDAVRLQFCTTAPEAQKRFGYELVKEQTQPFLTILWNSSKFVNEFFNRTEPFFQASDLEVEDKWISSRVNTLAENASAALEEHQYDVALQLCKDFIIEDFSRWYIKLVRDRTAQKDEALAYTFRYVLNRFSRILAPLAPYLTEEIYSELCKGEEESVHLASWPKPERQDKKLEQQMGAARDITQAILAGREKMQRGVRWPIKQVTISTKDDNRKAAAHELQNLIKGQTNTKLLETVSRFDDATMNMKWNFNQIKSDFENGSEIISVLRDKTPEQLYEEISKNGSYTLQIGENVSELKMKHLTITWETPEHLIHVPLPDADVFIDITLTPDLEAEGYAREMVRNIQSLRKDAKLQKVDKVHLVVVSKELEQILLPHKSDIQEKVGATVFEIAANKPEKEYEFDHSGRIKGKQFELFMSKV